MSIRFAFVIPTRNSSKTLRQAIISLAAQSYKNWHAIVIDDQSSDNTADFLDLVATELNVRSKFTIIRNTERMWEVANVLKAFEFIKDNEIICRLDLDDYLCDLNALEIIAKNYEKDPELDVVWTAHRWWDANGISTMNISGPMPPNADPYKHPWVASHFKTFKKSLLSNVADSNYRDKNGEYFKRIGDQTFMLPALYKARKYKFISIAAYAYFCPMNQSNFQTEDAKFQKEEAEFLRNRGFINE